MDFIVEDGTGLVDSTSYVDLTYADSYFENLGVTAWTAFTTQEKQTYLNKATQFIDVRWGALLKGYPLTLEQALQCPRKGLSDAYYRELEGIPIQLKKATCEYAIQASANNGELFNNPKPNDNQDLKKTKTVVGPITTEKEFFSSDFNGVKPSYPKADSMLRGLVVRRGGVYR